MSDLRMTIGAIPQPMKHVWISNAAFTRMTGIKKVCMVCGQPNTTADKFCPGKRREPGEER